MKVSRPTLKWIRRFFTVLFVLAFFPPVAGSTIIWSYSIPGITALSVSESGNYIGIGCQDGFYYIFDTWGTLTGSGRAPSSVVSLDIADTGEILIGTEEEFIFCTRYGTPVSMFSSYPVINVSISSNGTFSLVCSQGNLYINQEKALMQQLEVGDTSPFGEVSSHRDVACAAVDKTLYIVKDYEFYPYELEKEVEHLFISENGEKVVFSTGNDIGYINTEDGELSVKDIIPIVTMAAHPTGECAIIATLNAVFWVEGESMNELLSDSDNIHIVAFGGGSPLAVIGINSTLHIMTREGAPVLTCDFGSPLTHVEASQKGNILVVSTETSVHVIQLTEKTRSNNNVLPVSSGKSLPLTSPLEEMWSIAVGEDARFFVADMDGDGIPDIVLKEGSTIKLIDEDGIQKSVKDFGKPLPGVIPLDFDGDTLPEISMRFEPKFEFSVYNWRDELLRDYYFDLFRDMAPQGSVIPFAALDCDNDGDTEILATVSTSYACRPRGVVSINYQSGDIEWFYQMGPGILPDVLGDINNDGTLEIVTGCMAPCNCSDDEEYPDCETYVQALSGTGEPLWRVDLGYGFRRVRLSAEDIDPHPGEEIIGFGYEASGTWGSLFVLTCDGEYLYRMETEYSIFPGAVGDVDNNGVKEIVALDSQGYITIYTGDLQEKRKKFMGWGTDRNLHIYLNDINGDQQCEILTVFEQKMLILDKTLTVVWEREFEKDITIAVARFFSCKNVLFILSEKLYAFSYKDTEFLCPLWVITERTLTEEVAQNMEKGESSFLAGEYTTSRIYFERALEIFSQLENQEMVDSVSEKIQEISVIIFKQYVKMGALLVGAFDSVLFMVLLYQWVTKKRWYRLGEGALLLSLPIFLGLFQVYYAQEGYLQVFTRYFTPLFVVSSAVFLRQKIRGFINTILARRTGHRNMLVLSIGKGDQIYRVSLESIEEKFNPVKESREVRLPKEKKNELTETVKYTMDVLSQISSKRGLSEVHSAKKILREKGSTIYQSIIPPEFSRILKTKFLLLEVEDTDIPWELMYSDNFFAVKYAMSRRIVSTESVSIRQKRTSGRRALVICSPAEDLLNAQKECEFIYKRLKQKMETVFVDGENANIRRIADYFGEGFDIIHYAGHFKNGLKLIDGVMSPKEVQENLVGTPVVFVNGCTSEELAGAFLLGGAMAYVGTLHHVDDKSAAEFASDFYDLCLHHQIGEALRRARAAHMDQDMVWASVVMYGDPTLRLL